MPPLGTRPADRARPAVGTGRLRCPLTRRYDTGQKRRNGPGRPNPYVPEVDVADDESADEVSTRSRRTETLWADVRIDPVEIALPGGVGYTLRAYRLASEVADRDTDEVEERDLDDYEAASAAVHRRRRAETPDEEPEEVDDDDFAEEFDEVDDDEDEEEDDEEDEEEEEDEAAPADEETPIFLGRKGKVYLFHSPDKLIEFVKSGAEHDLSQLDSWDDLVRRVRSDDIDPIDEDRYELDLVVENLRGGPDAWDAPLILKAGELARDLGFALRLDPVMVAMSAGSPLDDLDEALRKADVGGVGSFFAKRRLRKIPAQQSSLAWRTVIGKISAAADWRD